MSERPETDSTNPPGRGPRWDRHLWGTEILFRGGAKLVIDEGGIGTFTDGSGETGMWDDTMAGWVDPSSGDLLHEQFGPPGFELSAEELEEAALRLDAQVAEMEEEMADMANQYAMPEKFGLIQKFAQRAFDLHEHASTLGGNKR